MWSMPTKQQGATVSAEASQLAAAPQREAASLGKNFTWTLVGNAVYSGGQWATLVLLAKLTRPELVGQYALGLAIVLPVLMFTGLQLRSVVTTDVREQIHFRDYLGFRLVSTGLALMIIFAIVLASGYRWQLRAVILMVGLAQAIEVISDIYFARLQLKDRLDRVSKSMITRTVLSALGLTVGVYFGHSLLWGIAGVVLARAMVLAGYDIRRHTHDLSPQSNGFSRDDLLKPRWDLRVQRELLWLGLPLGIITVLLSLSSSIPRYFIEHALGERALGIFSATVFMYAAGFMAIVSLGQSAFTRMATAYTAGNLTEFRSVLVKLLAIGATLGVCGIIVARLAGREILTILFRPEYAEHTDLLVTIMIAAAIQYLAALMGSAATAARFFKPQIPLLAGVVVTAGVVSYWLIPRYGLLGAGFAIVVTSAVLLLGETILLWWVLRELRRKGHVQMQHNRKTPQREAGVMLTQTLRSVAFLIRNIPLNRSKYHVVKWAGALNVRPSFPFYSRQLATRWSSAGFPDLLTRHMLFEGMYQQDVLLTLRNLVHPGDCVVDVGGHHGLMAVVAAKAAGPQGLVVSFEPNPTARRIFLENCKLNGVPNIRLEPLALSDGNGHAKFYIQKGAVSWNSSFFDNFASQHGRDEIEQIEVNMTTLDAYATDQALKPAFIKIDAEGSEFLILRGAMKTIQKHNPFISMEFNPESARTANTSVEEMQKVLENEGYRLVVLRRLRTGCYRFDRQEPFQPDKHCADELCNVLCIPSRLGRAWRHGREFQPLDPVSGPAVLSAGAY
jgi:FkbM family methyltransferase